MFSAAEKNWYYTSCVTLRDATSKGWSIYIAPLPDKYGVGGLLCGTGNGYGLGKPEGVGYDENYDVGHIHVEFVIWDASTSPAFSSEYSAGGSILKTLILTPGFTPTAPPEEKYAQG